jgi:hypothetical protein
MKQLYKIKESKLWVKIGDACWIEANCMNNGEHDCLVRCAGFGLTEIDPYECSIRSPYPSDALCKTDNLCHHCCKYWKSKGKIRYSVWLCNSRCIKLESIE